MALVNRGQTAGGVPKPVGVVDADGFFYGTELNPLAVDTTLNPNQYNEYAHRHTGSSSTLSVATTGDGTENTVTVVTDVPFAVNDHVQISNTGTEPTFAKILAKLGGNVLQLDRYIDIAHGIGATVDVISFELAVVGSLASPVVFHIKPEGGTTSHVVRLMLSMVHAGAGDMGLFGGMSVLTNGVIVRVKKNGVYHTLTNWKDNDEIKDDTYDLEFNTRAGGGGTYGTSARWSLNRLGAEARLVADDGDMIEIIIQDDLSAATGAGGGLTHFSIKGQGHYR